jgi:hypothetical protein
LLAFAKMLINLNLYQVVTEYAPATTEVPIGRTVATVKFDKASSSLSMDPRGVLMLAIVIRDCPWALAWLALHRSDPVSTAFWPDKTDVRGVRVTKRNSPTVRLECLIEKRMGTPCQFKKFESHGKWIEG